MRIWLVGLVVVGSGCGDNDFGEGSHTPIPHILNIGGPVLTSPRWAAITFPDDPIASDIDAFLTELGASDYWTTATGGYGVGAASMFPVHVSDSPPVTIDDAGIQSYLNAHLDPVASGWPAPDANTVYAVYYPDTTTVAFVGAALCDADSAAAYHSSFELLSNGLQVSYAVIP